MGVFMCVCVWGGVGVGGGCVIFFFWDLLYLLFHVRFQAETLIESTLKPAKQENGQTFFYRQFSILAGTHPL